MNTVINHALSSWLGYTMAVCLFWLALLVVGAIITRRIHARRRHRPTHPRLYHGTRRHGVVRYSKDR